MSRRWKRNQRLKCECGGYHFPHRKGGGACYSSKTRDIHVAIRGGNLSEIADARLEHALLYPPKPKPGKECPF